MSTYILLITKSFVQAQDMQRQSVACLRRNSPNAYEGRGLCAIIALWCYKNGWSSSTGNERKNFINTTEAKDFIAYLCSLNFHDHGQVTATDKSGAAAQETLRTKLSALKDMMVDDLSAPEELWIKGAELAVALHAIMSAADDSGDEKRPFALWEWDKLDNCFKLIYYASKTSGFTLRDSMCFQDYVDIIEDENTEHLAISNMHWAPARHVDLRTAFWEQGKLETRRQKRKLQEEKRAGKQAQPSRRSRIVIESSDEEEGGKGTATSLNEKSTTACTLDSTQPPETPDRPKPQNAVSTLQVVQKLDADSGIPDNPTTPTTSASEGEGHDSNGQEKAANEEQSPVSVMQFMPEQDVAGNLPTNPSTPTASASQQSQDPPSPPAKAPFA